MKIERCNPDTLAKPLAAYSQVVRAGSLVTTAGLIALDSDGKVVGEGDVAAQVRVGRRWRTWSRRSMPSGRRSTT